MKLEKLKSEDIVDTKYITEVSEVTGEIITYTKAVYSESGSKKIENNKRVKLSEKELHQYLKSEVGNFFFYFYSVLDEIDIAPQYKVRFLYLASYLDYNNDSIIDRGRCNIKIRINRQNLIDILCLKDREFRNTLNVLTKHNLIIKDGKHYNINTECGIKGNIPKGSNGFTRVFIDTIRKLYIDCDTKSHKQLYYIFKLLPYVNKQFNIPCRNVECDILGDIVPLSLKDICGIIGFDSSSTNKLWNAMRRFEIKGNYVVCKHNVDDTEFICINPRLFYAGTTIESVSYMIGVFDMAKNNSTRKLMPNN